MNAAAKALVGMICFSVLAVGAAPRVAVAQTGATTPGATTPGATTPGAAATANSKGAQAEAGEPRADTSAGPSPGTEAPAQSAPTAAAAPGAAAPRTARPPVAGGRAAPGTPGVAAAKSPAADRLDLGTATVTGDREQPKVMYIVPWKKSDIGDLSGKPMNSLLDEALAPVDRDEFKREVIYYQAVKADASQNGASGPPAKQGEK
jgi:hypothetical protein